MSGEIRMPMGVSEALLGTMRVASKNLREAGRSEIAELVDERANLLHEAMNIVIDYPATDHVALLYEVLEAVALASGRHFIATADERGVAAAKAALDEMAPALGAGGDVRDGLAQIREAARVPVGSYMVYCTGRVPFAKDGPVPRKGELVSSGALTMRVSDVHHTDDGVRVLGSECTASEPG